jgi:SGNH hydrolase-like domain, acetyltransferase AlgX
MELSSARGRLFFFMMLIIAFPMLQQSFHFFESGKLQGAVTSTPDTVFTWKAWWDGDLQRRKNSYLNDSTGCRPDLVRLNNEIDFRLFKKLHADNVEWGKDGYLFEDVYLAEYIGLDFIGDSAMRASLIKLKKIQDTLDRLGKSLVYVHAPSKAYIYPDKFPPWVDGLKKRPLTNYAEFKRIGDSLGLRQVDMNAWFMAMKDTCQNALFTRKGTHWSVYGSLLAADSMIKYIEHLRGISLPELRLGPPYYSDTPRNADDDIARGLNLIFPLPPERYTYRSFTYNCPEHVSKPKAIFIADSFFWLWMYEHLPDATSDWEFWYYFVEEWNYSSISGGAGHRLIKDYDWAKDLAKADCLIIEFTPGNLRELAGSDRYIEQIYRHYYPAGK